MNKTVFDILKHQGLSSDEILNFVLEYIINKESITINELTNIIIDSNNNSKPNCNHLIYNKDQDLEIIACDFCNISYCCSECLEFISPENHQICRKCKKCQRVVRK